MKYLLIALALSSSLAHAEFHFTAQSEAEAWKGHKMKEMIKKLGIPPRSMDLGDGEKVYNYEWSGGGQVCTIVVNVNAEGVIESADAQGRCRMGRGP